MSSPLPVFVPTPAAHLRTLGLIGNDAADGRLRGEVDVSDRAGLAAAAIVRALAGAVQPTPVGGLNAEENKRPSRTRGGRARLTWRPGVLAGAETEAMA